MQWTQDHDQTLSELWAQGLTGSQIATRMRTSRNAILGRARRIKLPTRISEESKPRIERDPYVHRETVVTAESARVPFEALEAFDGRCRYAHGDDAPYSFCGAKAVPGQSWCPDHLEAVFPTRKKPQLSDIKEQPAEQVGQSYLLEVAQ